jgi:hypothetical protein
MTKIRMLRLVVAAGAALAIGCGDSLSGKYEPAGEAAGAMSIEFKGDKAYITMIGTTSETGYEVKDDKVVFKSGGANGSNLVMTIEKDGSLSGPLGLKLYKKKS